MQNFAMVVPASHFDNIFTSELLHSQEL